MGNSIHHVLGNNDSPRFPCRLQLGTSAAIDLSTGVCDGSLKEYYCVLYNIDGSSCHLKLERLVLDGNVLTLYFELSDRKYLNFDKLILRICVRETNLSLKSYTSTTLSTYNYATLGTINSPFPFRDIKWTKTNKTNDACGGFTETNVYFYGSGNRVCLVVLECKINARDIASHHFVSISKVDAVTVAHYFANSSGTAFNPTEAADIGLSVITKISLSNGKLDTTVEGPGK